MAGGPNPWVPPLLRVVMAILVSCTVEGYSTAPWRHRPQPRVDLPKWELRAGVFHLNNSSYKAGLLPSTPTARCAQAYTGSDCKTPRWLPCFGYGFADMESLTLNQASNLKALEQLDAENRTVEGWSPSNQTHPPIEDEDLTEALPPLPFLGNRTHAFKSCALVGNSLSLVDSRFGRHIDDHEAVVRCNNAPTMGFKRDVGSWTSFRYQNERWTGSTEAGEPGVGRHCSTARSHGQLPCGNGTEFQESMRSASRQFMNAMDKKFHVINPAFDRWIENVFRPRAYASTGIRALGFLLHICNKVDVYGFGGTSSFREWYWSKYNGFDGKPPGKILKRRFPRLTKLGWHVDEWTYAGKYEYEAFAGEIVKKKHLPGMRPPVPGLHTNNTFEDKAAPSREKPMDDDDDPDGSSSSDIEQEAPRPGNLDHRGDTPQYLNNQDLSESPHVTGPNVRRRLVQEILKKRKRKTKKGIHKRGPEDSCLAQLHSAGVITVWGQSIRKMLHLNREVVISAVGDTTTLTLLKNSSNITSLADNNSTLNASDIAGTGIINYTADIAGDGGVWGNELSELR